MKTINYFSRFVVVPVVLLLLSLSSALAAGAGSAKSKPAPTTTVQRINSSGAAVDASWNDELEGGFLLVTVDTINNSSSAFLTYNRVTNDPASQVCTSDPLLGTFCSYTRVTFDSFNGNINPNDITIGANTARVNTDSALATNVVYETCTYDAGTTTCSSVPPQGMISVDWRKTSTDFTKFSGMTETKTGPEILRITGSRQQFSANASGSLLGGAPVQNIAGSMGTTQSVAIDIIRTR